MAEGADPSLLSAADAGGGGHGYVLDLPDLGRLRLGDTVYLMREGPRTFGLLFARDGSARPCTLILLLQRGDGHRAWRATVARVTRQGEQSRDGLGASFLFDTRLWGENELEGGLTARVARRGGSAWRQASTGTLQEACLPIRRAWTSA